SAELRVALLGGRVLAEETPATHAGRAAQCTDLETGVVGDRPKAAGRRVRTCLRRCVLGEGLRVLVRLRWHRVEVGGRDELYVDSLENFAVFAELAGIRRAEKETVPILGLAAHA